MAAKKRYEITACANIPLSHAYHTRCKQELFCGHTHCVSQVMAAKKRYEVGLQKLAFTAEQVVVMQGELTALKPNLIKTVAETERLMATVSKEKTDVVEPKKVRTRTHQPWLHTHTQTHASEAWGSATLPQSHAH